MRGCMTLLLLGYLISGSEHSTRRRFNKRTRKICEKHNKNNQSVVADRSKIASSLLILHTIIGMMKEVVQPRNFGNVRLPYFYYYLLLSIAFDNSRGDRTVSATILFVGADRGTTTWTQASGAPASTIIPSYPALWVAHRLPYSASVTK